MNDRVLVVGDALLDVHVSPRAPIRAGADVPAAIELRPGGQGANLAVRLARRGLPVHLATALGPDPAGAILRRSLEAEGVGLEAAEAAATGTVVVLVDGAGERTMLSQRVPLLEQLSRARLVTGAAWIVLSGYVLLEAGAQNELRSARDLAARRMVVGCALAREEADGWSAIVGALDPDLVVLNRDEAEMLGVGGATTDAMAARLSQRLGAMVVVTEAQGAAAAVGGRVSSIERPDSRAPVVDTTGAGDAFAAALLGELIHEPWPPSSVALERALGAAVELGSAVARTGGAQARVPGEVGATLEP